MSARFKTPLFERSFFRRTATPALVYIYVPVLISCCLLPAFLADLFWRTLGTELPLTIIAFSGFYAGHLIVRALKKTYAFDKLQKRDRSTCILFTYVAAIIYPCSSLLLLNASILSPSLYSQDAIITSKISGGGKSGVVDYYVAFRNTQYNDYGVHVSKKFYTSVGLGSKVTVNLKKGLLAFPVVVYLTKE